MSPNTNDKKSNNRYKGKNRPSWRSGGYRKQKSSAAALFICTVCEEGVKEVGNAIDYKGGPAHFDCVLRSLTEQEKLNQGEKIAYIGSGRFGVIVNKKNDAGGPFTLLREIDVEDREKTLPWRDERKIYVSVEEKKESEAKKVNEAKLESEEKEENKENK